MLRARRADDEGSGVLGRDVVRVEHDVVVRPELLGDAVETLEIVGAVGVAASDLPLGIRLGDVPRFGQSPCAGLG